MCGGNDPLLGCYRTCKALQGPGRCFSSIQGSFVHSHANLPQFKLQILLGGLGGGDYDPQITEVPWEQDVPLH